MRYARIIEEKVVEVRDFGVAPDPNPKKGLDWRPRKIADMPRYDPATQVLVGPSYRVGSDEVVEYYKARDKTKEELDAEAKAKLPPKDSCIFKVMLDHENRVRALEGRSSVTAEQYRALLKTA